MSVSSKGNLFQALKQRGAPPYRGASPGGLSIGRGSSINQRQLQQPLHRCPLAEHHADLIEFALPHYPNTDEGWVTHHTQCAKWHANNPTSWPDKCHQYPLTPGTESAGSFEC